MAKKDWTSLSKTLIGLVGGKDNISSIRHCITRLRFDLKDSGLADREGIKNTPGLLGIKEAGDEFQVVIGPDVADFYEVIVKEAGVETQEAVDENLDGGLKKAPFSLKKILNNIVGYLGKSVATLVPLLIGSSLCRTIAILLGPGMLNVISAESDIYILLTDFIYNATFYFLPILVGYTASKNLKYDPIYGIFIACLTLVPSFTALVGVRDTFSVYGLPAPVANYGQAILPVLIGAFICKYVVMLARKISPNIMKAVTVPIIVMLLMAPVMYVVCCPLGSYIGNLLGSLFNWFTAAPVIFRVIGSVLLAGLIPFMTAGGMHAMVYTFAFTNFINMGYETFVFNASYCFAFGICGLALGAFLKVRTKDEKSSMLSCFLTALTAGISEPTLYGLTFKYKKGILATFLGCAIGGLYFGIMQPKVYGAGTMPTIFTVWGIWGGGSSANLISGLLLVLISFAAGFLCAYFIIDYKTENL